MKIPGDAIKIDDRDIYDPYLQKGQELSVMYCSACHTYPDPSLLPKSTWRFETLPAMAPFMGVDPFTGESVQSSESTNPFIPEHIYPPGAIVSPDEWQNIVDFYWQLAPDELIRAEKKTDIIIDSLFFTAQIPEFLTESEPIVTAAQFDEELGIILISNTTDLSLYVFNRELDLVHQSAIESPISHISLINGQNDTGKREFLATFIGHLYPSDAPYGSVRYGIFDSVNLTADIDSIIFKNLARPVGSQFADITGDGVDELIVNEFGHRFGSLFWQKKDEGDNTEDRHILINTPGCIQSYVLDYTGNGMKDIVPLCTQSDQAIYLFKNKGNTEFEMSTLLQFDITAGSSSFEMVDFNGNGHLDILYTSGDNADYSKIFKPYHGVYIFLNDGTSRFEEKWFYPLNGAYHAKARDFNGNGIMDIAVISFFADYEHSPEEGFVFFKNRGSFNFTPYHHPATNIGRWLTMDVADWTGNGRYDILLGNTSAGVFGHENTPSELQSKWEEGPLFMILENIMH